LRPDGRLHPSYMLYHGAFNNDEDDESGTVSGRLAAKDPAIQTLPKRTPWAKRLRECYEAPEDCLCFDADFNQLELRLAACIAPEPKMLAAYQEGMDLHSITAATMAGMALAPLV
jgi:DNA polymerase I-like protein with 3'-5' exonuclease and polymerase domains